MKTTFNVLGMVCNHCVAEVKNALLGLEGVEQVEVDLASRLAVVTGEVAIEEIVNTLAVLGYAATIKKD